MPSVYRYYENSSGGLNDSVQKVKKKKVKYAEKSAESSVRRWGVKGQTSSQQAFLYLSTASSVKQQQHSLLSIKRSENAYSTWYSQAASHPRTNQTGLILGHSRSDGFILFA